MTWAFDPPAPVHIAATGPDPLSATVKPAARASPTGTLTTDDRESVAANGPRLR